MSDKTISQKAILDFLAEAEEIVEQLGSELADLADMADSKDLNPDLLNSIFRGAHSLKGLAGMFGFSEISELSHNMENLLDSLRLGKIDLDPELITTLFSSHELLTSLVRSLASGETGNYADEIEACKKRINSSLNPTSKASKKDSPIDTLSLPERITAALTEYEEHRLLDNISKGKKIFIIHTSFDLTTFDTELGAVSDLLKKSGEIISTLPSMGGNIETNIDFDLLFGTTKDEDEIKSAVESENINVNLCGSISKKEEKRPEIAAQPAIEAAPPVEAPAEKAISIPAKAETATEDATQSAKSMSRTVRVDIGKLDELMNIVGELVLAHSTIANITIKLRNDGFSKSAIELGKAAKELERRLSDLQKGVIDIRMIPVGQLYEKLSRIVRKISREQGKKIELKFFGAETELDKLIVEDISDPMMHIIRNAIDHGIEAPEKRITAGKDEKGVIKISSYQKGNHVIIEVEDDGNGIDVEKVKLKAQQKGLVADISSVSDKDALDFIFLPGFSTTDKVSEVSGRGVGMDVVKNNIAAISGIVDIETKKGNGTKFLITLPITLAIIKALIIKSASRIYALPITSVLESIIITSKEIKKVERKEVIQLRDTTLPLLRLDSFFGIDRKTEVSDEFYVVVVGVAEKRLGLVVDELMGQQDIVIKSLGEAFKRFRGISGAADLGDQRTILVLDVAGMMQEAMRSGG